jgi:hypothetical protein
MAKIAKAITAGLGAASAAVVTATQDGNVTVWEWLTALGAAVLIGLATWRIPNTQIVP